MYTALPKEKYLFISHNSADKKQVIRIQKRLENHALATEYGLKVWLDIDDIHNNTGFQKQILEAIRDKVCAFAVYRTDNEVTSWMDREIEIAHSRYMEDNKNKKCFPLISCLPKTTSDKISTSVLIDDFNYIQNIEDPDSIARLITEALCLNTSKAQISTQTQNTEVTPSANNLHTIIYRLTQQNGTAYMQNNLDESREHDASRLQIDKFGDIPIKEMSNFLLGSQSKWQMLNQQLAEVNPKRIRIMSDNPQLALLPWQRLKAPDSRHLS